LYSTNEQRKIAPEEILLFFTSGRHIFLIFILYFALRPTNAQLFHKLLHSYVFRHYRVFLREVLINILPILVTDQLNEQILVL